VRRDERETASEPQRGRDASYTTNEQRSIMKKETEIGVKNL